MSLWTHYHVISIRKTLPGKSQELHAAIARSMLCDPPEGTEMSLSVSADAFCAECSDVTCVVLGWSIPVHASRVLALAGRNLTQKPKNSSHEFDTQLQHIWDTGKGIRHSTKGYYRTSARGIGPGPFQHRMLRPPAEIGSCSARFS